MHLACVLALCMRAPLRPLHLGLALCMSESYTICCVRKRTDAERTHAALSRDVSQGGCLKCNNSCFCSPGDDEQHGTHIREM